MHHCSGFLAAPSNGSLFQRTPPTLSQPMFLFLTYHVLSTYSSAPPPASALVALKNCPGRAPRPLPASALEDASVFHTLALSVWYLYLCSHSPSPCSFSSVLSLSVPCFYVTYFYISNQLGRHASLPLLLSSSLRSPSNTASIAVRFAVFWGPAAGAGAAAAFRFSPTSKASLQKSKQQN